jgi:hypothetical protein
MYEDVVSSPRKSVSNSVTGNDDDEVYEDIISSPKKSATSLPPADEVYEYVETGSKIPVSEPCTSVSEASTESAGPPLIQDDIYSTIPDVYDNFPRGNHLHEQIEAPSEAPSEAPKLPPRPDSMKSASVQEGDMQVQDIEEDTTVYADVENGGSSYTRLKPAYTEMPIFDDPSDSGEPASSGKLLMKSKSNLTPKTKRRWLRSPLFGRRKGSVSADDREIHSEGAGSDREREEKKSGEGLMRKLMGSRSSKSRKAVKQKSASSVKVSSKVSYDSDSDGSSSVEEHLAASNTEESRTRSTSEIGPSDQLKAEIIPRSNSYSPAATAEVGYELTTHKKLDPSSQRVVSSDPETLRESDEVYATTTHKELNPLTQRVVSDTSLAQSSSNSDSASITGEKRASSDRLSDKPIHYRKSPSLSPQRGATQLRKSGSNNPLSLDIRSLIDNMGEGLEFCEEYSKKLNVPSLTEPTSSGSAPGGLRLPVPFQLKTGSSQPSLVTVGFDVQSGSERSQSLSNGVGGGDTDEKRGVSDSSTASEGEEQGSSGPEQEDALEPMESSLDQGRDTRYDIKRRLSENSDKQRAVLPPTPNSQNTENLVVTSLMYADAVWDRVGLEHDELSFRVGDVIEILDMSDDMWWQGNVREKSGWFPSTFVRLRIAQDEEDEDIYAVPPDAEQGSSTLPRGATMPAGDPTYATYSRPSNSKRRMTIRYVVL